MSTLATIYAPGKLLVSVVGRNHGEAVVESSKKAGARGGTVILARGTAENRILQMLCLGDLEKDLVLTLAPSPEMPAIVAALRDDPRLARKAPGIGFVINVPGMLRHILPMPGNAGPADSNPATTGDLMSEQASHELISVIVNAGYADDVMLAARKAGAKGGTVINARGTGREEDVTFFGITIVPEKELLMILVEKQAAPAILEAIRRTPCLNEPGIGIAFCTDVESFFLLGRGDMGSQI